MVTRMNIFAKGKEKIAFLLNDKERIKKDKRLFESDPRARSVVVKKVPERKQICLKLQSESKLIFFGTCNVVRGDWVVDSKENLYFVIQADENCPFMLNGETFPTTQVVFEQKENPDFLSYIVNQRVNAQQSNNKTSITISNVTNGNVSVSDVGTQTILQDLPFDVLWNGMKAQIGMRYDYDDYREFINGMDEKIKNKQPLDDDKVKKVLSRIGGLLFSAGVTLLTKYMEIRMSK